MKLIAQNAKGHYKEIILGPLFKLLEAILELLVPLVVADMIDAGVMKGDMNYVLTRAGMLVGIAALGVTCAMICQYYAAKAGGAFGRSLRRQLYVHVLRLSPSQAAHFGAGSLSTRLTNDANNIQAGLNMMIRLGTRAPFLAIGSVVMAMYLNPRIGIIFLICTPVVALVLYMIMRYTIPGYEKVQHKQDELSRLSGENLSGIRVIRAFSRQKEEQAQYDDAASGLSLQMMRVGKISAAVNPITNIIVSAAIVCIVWMGAGYAASGDVLPGEVIALVAYMNQVLLALIVAANLTVLFTRALASTRRVAEVLNTQPTIADGIGAQPIEDAPAVEFKDVCFAYHEGAQNALEHISFTAQRGQTIGVIGGTGSGKSSLVNLMVRHYDTSGGEVLIGGQDVRAYKLHELRAQMGVVPQTAALFSGSVRQNLQIANPNASDEEMWQALSDAQAQEFVQQMPNGGVDKSGDLEYVKCEKKALSSPHRRRGEDSKKLNHLYVATPKDGLNAQVHEGGKNLSGGQKQRLCVARALVKAPQILILDDATSALDYTTDAKLRSALKKISQECTVFFISQRVDSIKEADRILVMDDGVLAGQGTHEELLRSCEVYREICASQDVDAEVQA